MFSKIKNNKIESLMYILTFLCFISVLFYCFNMSIWFDEAFSLKLAEHSYIDVIKLTAIDCHPPLYYIYLKFFITLFGGLTGLETIYVAKIASTVPLILLIILSATVIRNEWGNRASALFSLFIAGTPRIVEYYMEIRMYSLSLLFVTLCYICTYFIIKNGKLRYWIMFSLIGLASAYTHYFCCFAVAVIYLFILIYLIVYKKENIKIWLLFAFLMFIGYIPWLPALHYQLIRVGGGFPIPDLTIIGTIKLFCYPFIITKIMPFGAFGLIVVPIAVYVYYNCKKSNNGLDFIYVIFGAMVPVMVIAISCIISVIFVPIILSRYIIPSLGCFWLSFAIGLKYVKAKYQRIIVLVMIIIVFFDVLRICVKEQGYKDNFNEYSLIIENNIDDNTDIVSNTHLALCSNYLYGNDTYVYDNVFTVMYGVFGNIKDEQSIEDIKTLCDKGDVIIALEDINITDEQMKNKYDPKYFKTIDLGNASFEDYSFRILKISKGLS